MEVDLQKPHGATLVEAALDVTFLEVGKEADFHPGIKLHDSADLLVDLGQFSGTDPEVVGERLVILLFEFGFVFLELADHLRVLAQDLFLEFLHAEVVPVLKEFDSPIRCHGFFRNPAILASYWALGALQEGDSKVSDLIGEYGVIGEEANTKKLLEPELGLGSGPVESQDMVAIGFIDVQDEAALVDLVRVNSVFGGDAEVSMVRRDAEEWLYRFRLQDAKGFDRLFAHYSIADPCNTEVS